MTPEQTLWSEVLYLAVIDALEGMTICGGTANPDTRSRQTEAARRYFTQPSADFAMVCNMAGLDPVAVREHITRQISTAPTPAEIAARGGRRKPDRTYTFNDQTLTLKQWAEITGLPLTTLRTRSVQGWSVERMLTAPHNVRQKAKSKQKPTAPRVQMLTFKGQTRTIAQWSMITGIKVHTLHMRLRSGWSDEATLTTKPIPRGTPPKVASAFTPPAEAPGVGPDFAPSQGTGGGPAAQESSLNNFCQDSAA